MNLEQALAKFGAAEYNADSGELILKASDISSDEAEQIMALLNAGQSEPDLSDYFPAIAQSPMFKPANPIMAIRHVAKHYGLDVDALSRQFKSHAKISSKA